MKEDLMRRMKVLTSDFWCLIWLKFDATHQSLFMLLSQSISDVISYIIMKSKIRTQSNTVCNQTFKGRTRSLTFICLWLLHQFYFCNSSRVFLTLQTCHTSITGSFSTIIMLFRLHRGTSYWKTQTTFLNSSPSSMKASDLHWQETCFF